MEAVAARLRAAGCVWAEDEATILVQEARSDAELEAMIERRADGLPLEQVVGWAQFHGRKIFVAPGVFVPRRRSYFLLAVADSAASPGARVVVDLCCGTGALGLVLALQMSGREPARVPGPERADTETIHDSTGDLGGIELHAADIDPAAVACARRNLGPVGGHVYAGDLYQPLPATLRGRVDVLICNAPYVPTSQIKLLPAEAREHEPRSALDGGADGLAVLRLAAAQAPAWLAPGGVLLVETSDLQGPAMAAVMRTAGLAAEVHSSESGATVVTGKQVPA